MIHRTWRRAIPLSKRFWYKVWPRGDCWEWRGSRNPISGYGNFNIGCFTGRGESTAAHRFAYEEAKGTIPLGMTIDHLCRHRWCVKPSHLEVVTQDVNNKRGWNQNRKKNCCSKCGGPFRLQIVKSGANVGKRQRFYPPCKKRWHHA
jgi:hypothetical protein